MNILADCPFAPVILGLEQPKRLLLLGSGTSLAPKSWLDIPNLQVVRFNAKTLGMEYYHKVQTYGLVCWKKTLLACESFRRQQNPLPHLFVLDDNVLPSQDREAKRYVFDDGHRERVEDVGTWFAGVSQDLTDQHGSLKIYTTGFYMTLWLLGGSQTEIYIAGFDGYKQYPIIQHADPAFPDLPHDNKHHSYNSEWSHIEKAVAIACERGIKVEIAQT
jgi:hypothetical protein